MFSTIQDQQSRELSQKHTARKAKKLKVGRAGMRAVPHWQAAEQLRGSGRVWCRALRVCCAQEQSHHQLNTANAATSTECMTR